METYAELEFIDEPLYYKPNLLFIENSKIINISKIHSDEYMNEISNTFIDETNITIIDYDIDIYTETD